MTSSRNYIKLDEKVNAIHSIPPRAKILHGEICALSQNNGYCFASNKYFAKQLNLSIQSVSRLIGILKRYDLITVTRITDDNGYRKRIIKPNSSIVLSKISVGNAQKREKPTLKYANHNIVSRIDKNNTSYGLFITLSNYTPNALKYLDNTPIIRGISGLELAELILKYYDKLSDKSKKIIPLTPVYIPDIKVD